MDPPFVDSKRGATSANILARLLKSIVKPAIETAGEHRGFVGKLRLYVPSRPCADATGAALQDTRGPNRTATVPAGSWQSTQCFADAGGAALNADA